MQRNFDIFTFFFIKLSSHCFFCKPPEIDHVILSAKKSNKVFIYVSVVLKPFEKTLHTLSYKMNTL